VIAIVQARMGSRRLPGKTLTEIHGRTLLQYLLDRLERCRTLTQVVIATSDQPIDDPVAEYCSRMSIACHRGDHDDVAGRYLSALDVMPSQAFVRLSGDSPVLDTSIVDRAVELYQAGDWDLVTNIQTRTFPRGQSVEVLRTEAFRRAYARMADPEEREHVTPHFYKQPERYRIHNFVSGRTYPGVHIAVDTPEDLKLFTRIAARMSRPHWEYDLPAVLALHAEVAGSHG
jgi:spore coat polysaccharide biosynthesis protein SpsF